MEWKEFFKVDKTRVLWFFLSIPLSAFLSLLLFLLLESLFTMHVPMWFYVSFSIIISVGIGYVVDSIHSNLKEHHHKLIFYTIKGLVIVASIILLIVMIMAYSAINMATIKKPAIYLYPEQDSSVMVNLNINGKIINDIPEYGDGWKVFVTKEGIIDNKYDYLFYEAELNKVILPKEGWVVEYADLNDWFDTNLRLMGLNDKETAQFKEYWLASLPVSDYYEIKLLEGSYLKDNMDLIVSPEPDTIIRLEFYFKPLKERIDIKEPAIYSPERQGFTVIEWGGILDD